MVMLPCSLGRNFYVRFCFFRVRSCVYCVLMRSRRRFLRGWGSHPLPFCLVEAIRRTPGGDDGGDDGGVLWWRWSRNRYPQDAAGGSVLRNIYLKGRHIEPIGAAAEGAVKVSVWRWMTPAVLHFATLPRKLTCCACCSPSRVLLPLCRSCPASSDLKRPGVSVLRWPSAPAYPLGRKPSGALARAASASASIFSNADACVARTAPLRPRSRLFLCLFCRCSLPASVAG